MFFCSVNHRKQHLLSRLCPQGSMFDKNDARVEQERAEAEEKRQRRQRCHSLHWPTRGLDQHLDQQTKSGPQNWVSWVSVRKSTSSCVSSTYYPRMAMESPQVSEWCWWNSGCQDHQKLREDLRDHGQPPRRVWRYVGWCLIVATRSVRLSIKIIYLYIYIYKWF